MLELAPALVVLPGPSAAAADAVAAKPITPAAARTLFECGPVLVVHAGLTARRLGQNAPMRSPWMFDVLELFAFVRPGQFCAPSAAGLAQALGIAEPKTAVDHAATLRAVAGLLLNDLAAAPTPSHEEALALAEMTRLFPSARGALRLAQRVCWHQDPLAGGSWANWAPGQISRFAQAIVQPHGRLHFAGEHTGFTIRGMEAAMESGERAATEILSRL